jgi:hypothetical protein
MNYRKYWVGIDNGVSGSIGIISDRESIFFPTPIRTEQSYTKTKQGISRLQTNIFMDLLECHVDCTRTIAVIERPYVNTKGFKASISAVRCLEAQLICLEWLNVPHIYIDSKQWQRELLPKGIKGKSELKKASKDIGIRLFPMLADEIIKQKDADGLLIAEWARRNNI